MVLPPWISTPTSRTALCMAFCLVACRQAPSPDVDGAQDATPTPEVTPDVVGPLPDVPTLEDPQDEDPQREDTRDADAPQLDDVPAQDVPPHGASLLRPDPPGMACVRDPACMRLVLVAHRGAHKSVPENSLASIREAARLGMDLAEIDVRTTADGVLVVMHDTTVDRTTDQEGDVASWNWEALQGATLRGADASDPQTQRIPTLDEALRLAVVLEIGLYLDVKEVEVDALVSAIDAAQAWNWVLVRKSVEVTAQVRVQRPDALVLPAVREAAELEGWPTALGAVAQVELGRPTANADFANAATRRGLRVQQDVLAGGDLTGSLGNYTGYRSFVEAGVWMLQTNECEALLDAVGVYEQTGVFPASAAAR